MTAPDMVLVISAFGGLIISVGGLVVQIITAMKVAKVEVHTNSMYDAAVKAAEEKGRQDEKNKQ